MDELLNMHPSLSEGEKSEIAIALLSTFGKTRQEIDRILTIPGIVEFLVVSTSGLVDIAISASTLGAPIVDIKQPSEKPTPTVQVSSIIPPQQPKKKLIKVCKRETPVFLDKVALESMKTEIGVFLQSEIQKILVNCPKYKPWQQIITQAITQWNKSNPIQSLYKYDSLCGGLKNPGGQWRSQYGIHNVEDACRVFGISLPQNMMPVKKLNKKLVSHIPDGAQDPSHPATALNIPDNENPIPDTLGNSVFSRYLGTPAPGPKGGVQAPRAKGGVQSPLSTSSTRLPRNSGTTRSKNLTESNLSFELKDLHDLLKSMNELLSTVYANINKKDGNIQEKWQGIGDIGTFSWEKKSLKGKPTIIIRFDEAQKQQRVESKKIWVRLATKIFTEHLLKSGWKFSGGLNNSEYGKYYTFKYGNFQIQFHLPYGIEALNNIPKVENVGRGTDKPIDMNSIGENELGVVKSLLSEFLQKIYFDTSREHSASGNSEIGQRKKGISQNKDEFVFDTGKSGYEIERQISNKKLIIYPTAFPSRHTDKLMEIMEFFKKKELLEKFLESNGFRKDDDGKWIHNDSMTFIFQQNGSNPILEFQIDEWKIEIHTGNR